jgi:hypothetical protein
VIAVAAVTVGAVVVWVWNPPRPRDPGTLDGPPTNQNPSDDLLWEEARAKKLPEYAELRAPFDTRKPFADEYITRLLELAGHRNVWIRTLAVQRLGHVTGSRRGEAMDRLVQCLRDPNLHVRASAMSALAVADARDRIPDLLPFLSSPDRDERSCARHALKRLGHPVGD